MSKRQEMREKRMKQQRNQRIIIGAVILLGALLVAFALILPGLNQQNATSAYEFKERPQPDFNRMGDPNAPITITVFSDYKCGHCAAFALQTEPLLIDEYIKTGKVYFVYRSMGAWTSPSTLAVEASYCAGDENKFWEFHDLIFINQTANFSNSLMSQFANQLGLNMDNFNACLSSGKYRSLAEQDAAEGAARGVQGTPTFFITYQVNGEPKERVLPGNYPYSGFQREIEAALDEMGL